MAERNCNFTLTHRAPQSSCACLRCLWCGLASRLNINMKLVTSLLICLLNILPEPSLSAENITGIWSATERTKGGLGSQWTFFENGIISLTFGALVDFKYEIEDNFILMHMAGDKEIKEEFNISGDTLTIKSENSPETQIMKWAGIPADIKQPLIGNWTYPHYTGQTALMRYTRGGLAQLSVPFVVENGTYSIRASQVVIAFRNKETKAYSFVRNKNKLTLEDLKTKEVTVLELLEY